jgi:hypothetical protein
MQPNVVQQAINKPLFDPSYLNMEYVFSRIQEIINPIIKFILNPHTWTVAGVISSIMSIICITIIVYCLVRMREIQLYDKWEISHEIHEAELRDKETARNENPRWNYVLTLTESPNESDWRMAIVEADSLMEESLKENGLIGDTVSELLEQARSNGYASIQNAWDAHLIRNKIAHEGSNYPLSQVEARRVIKMYQNFFEEIKII